MKLNDGVWWGLWLVTVAGQSAGLVPTWAAIGMFGMLILTAIREGLS